MFDELIYLIYKILRVRGYGIASTNKLLLSLEQTVDIFDNSESFLLKLKSWVRKEFSEGFFEPDLELNTMLRHAENKNVGFLNLLDSNYPFDLKLTLRNIAPPIISFIGNSTLLNKNKVGFCGSRKASDKGLDVAKDCAMQLADMDIVVVSGYASGVDIQTHYWALKNGGNTIIVLPEGINKFYIKKELKEVWDWSKVLVLSEFEPNDIWSTSRAMQRNNTIIGVSNAMILIEAGEKGGSIDAGNKTLKFNKYLFAPIYEGMPDSAVGNELLITKGAFPLKRSSKTLQANLAPVFKAVEISNRSLNEARPNTLDKR